MRIILSSTLFLVLFTINVDYLGLRHGSIWVACLFWNFYLNQRDLHKILKAGRGHIDLWHNAGYWHYSSFPPELDGKFLLVNKAHILVWQEHRNFNVELTEKLSFYRLAFSASENAIQAAEEEKSSRIWYNNEYNYGLWETIMTAWLDITIHSVVGLYMKVNNHFLFVCKAHSTRWNSCLILQSDHELLAKKLIDPRENILLLLLWGCIVSNFLLTTSLWL